MIPKLKNELQPQKEKMLNLASMKSYNQITKIDRLEISILHKKGYSNTAIAEALCRHKSTIGRELRRNKVSGTYNAKKAHHKAYVKRKYAKYQYMSIIEDMKLREFIDTKLKKEWSPEQISGRLALEAGFKKVSSPTIYKYIRSVYGRQLEHELGLAKQKRKKKCQRIMTKLEDRVFIDQRPESANNRSQYGHWEGDFIVSGKPYGNTSLVVLHERVSRYTLIRKIPARTVLEVETTLCQFVKQIGPFKSLTLDNDIAFQKHLKLSTIVQAPVFFCHPYHSWEKGGVENANRFIRRYVPKGCDIANFNDKDIEDIQTKINNRPRKVLGFYTATEMYTQYKQAALQEEAKHKEGAVCH